jgi:RND superfamily putative drug exporter
LTATGGVITSAGILLAAVFAVLGVLPLVVLAQIGVVICVGVLLDTLLVRTIVVPAFALWFGDRFWWPRAPQRATESTPSEVRSTDTESALRTEEVVADGSGRAGTLRGRGGDELDERGHRRPEFATPPAYREDHRR